MNSARPPHRPGRPAYHPLPAALLTVGCLLLAGCSGADGAQADANTGKPDTDRMTIALVGHGDRDDAVWELVRRGAEAAAAKDHVELTYVSDSDGAAQADLVRDVIHDKADGIAVTLAKPEAMKGPVAEARAAGIPVVALNSGIEDWKSAGALAFFGQDESVAGRAVGDKLNGLKARHTLCVIHEPGSIALEARCAGLKKTFDGRADMLYVDGGDMDAAADSLTTQLRQDPSIDEVVTNSARLASTAMRSVHEADSKARVATFDLSKDVIEAVRTGHVQFAVDQQPYLQGYLAVDALWLYRTRGNTSGGGVAPVLTGPEFVTRTNVAAVTKYAAAGTR